MIYTGQHFKSLKSTPRKKVLGKCGVTFVSLGSDEIKPIWASNLFKQRFNEKRDNFSHWNKNNGLIGTKRVTKGEVAFLTLTAAQCGYLFQSGYITLHALFMSFTSLSTIVIPADSGVFISVKKYDKDKRREEQWHYSSLCLLHN